MKKIKILLGIHEKPKANKYRVKPSINIEKQCATCATSNLSTRNDFKMACLAYTPSNIVYNKTAYIRKELIEAKQKLLNNVEYPINMGAILESIKHRPQTSVGLSSRHRYSMSPVSTAFMSQTPDDQSRIYRKHLLMRVHQSID